jgi:hypothetical protein
MHHHGTSETPWRMHRQQAGSYSERITPMLLKHRGACIRQQAGSYGA